MLTPSIGRCGTPFTDAGSLMPTTSSSVGAMSITWWNWNLSAPASRMRSGQETTMPLRVPPKCDAICFVHWNGVSPAQAQPTG